MFFSSWDALGRVLIVGSLAYVALVFMLRVSGKRTLSKMNAFDFVVTVAIGSVLASTLTSKDSALAEGVLALALLIGLQYVITWLSVRSNRFQRLIKATPTLVYYQGEFIAEAMTRQRVTTEEVRSAIRKHGSSRMEAVEAVVLEADGSFTVLETMKDDTRHRALANVEGADRFENLDPGDTRGPVAERA